MCDTQPPAHLRCQPAAPWKQTQAATNFLVHLRLHYQLMLAPFMLWGAALARVKIDVRFVVALLVLHVCMYGGTTAYNSHFDRDEGPVGGIEHPPPAGPWLLRGSLALQALGLAVALVIGARFFFVCLSFGVLGVVYSHPATRWKGRPWLSWVTVIVGQGGLGTAAGLALGGSKAPITMEVALGVAGAALLAGAVYPLTQLFQTEEDRARGDRTLAIRLGRGGTRAVAALTGACGGLVMALSALEGGRAFDAGLFVFMAVAMVVGSLWVCQPTNPRDVFRRISRLQLAAAVGFGSYAAMRLLI